MFTSPSVTQTTSTKLPYSWARYLLFFALVIVSLALWWRPLVSTLQLALDSDAYTHILLILPLSLGLMYFDKKPLVKDSQPSMTWTGWIFLIAAAAIRLVWWTAPSGSSRWLALEMFGFVLFSIGSVLVSFRFRTVRSHLFPLCFLFLLIPLPGGAIDWLTTALQHQSAVATEGLFRLARIPVTRDDVLLSIPGLDIEVARECSSIRSSTMLVVATLVLAHLFLRSWWRQILLLVLAIPLSVAKNAVRILTITELGTRVDPSYLNGELHHKGGLIFLGLALMLDVVILWTLKRSEASAALRMEKAR